MEQDYSHLRDAETRYRLLFQTSSEAVLILDPARQRVVEANPAAREMLGSDLRDIVGHALLHRIADPEKAGSYLAAVRSGETPAGLQARLVHGGREVLLRASAFRQDQATMLLVRISSAHAVAAATSLSEVKTKLLRAVESAPTASSSPTTTASSSPPTPPSSTWPDSSPKRPHAASRWTAGSANPASISPC